VEPDCCQLMRQPPNRLLGGLSTKPDILFSLHRNACRYLLTFSFGMTVAHLKHNSIFPY